MEPDLVLDPRYVTGLSVRPPIHGMDHDTNPQFLVRGTDGKEREKARHKVMSGCTMNVLTIIQKRYLYNRIQSCSLLERCHDPEWIMSHDLLKCIYNLCAGETSSPALKSTRIPPKMVHSKVRPSD